jgi:hypothetical protein
MVLVSLLTLTIGGGGYTDLNAFGFVAILLVMFWGLPLIVLITLFHFLDKRFGPYARYPIIDRALAFAPGHIFRRARRRHLHESHHYLRSGVVCRLAGNVAYFLQSAAQRNWASRLTLSERPSETWGALFKLK